MLITDEKRVKIVLIDSGVNTKTSDMVKYVKKSTGLRISEDGYIIQDDALSPTDEHGTAIALTIRHICENVEITSINILDKNLSADGRVLICAFQRAILYKPDIIHMSLGTTRWIYRHHLKKLVKEAFRLNIIIVSAADNYGAKSYPAYINGVVGVKGYRKSGYMSVEYRDGFFYAPFGIENIKGVNELDSSEHLSGNSMAAGYITGHLALLKYTKHTFSNKEIIEHLKTLDKQEGDNL